MTTDTRSPASQIERAEGAIVDLLKSRLGNDVRVEAQPDDPAKWDMGTAENAVLVHFAESRPSGDANRLAGPVGFAAIVLSRSLRGASGGYRLLEKTEQALSGSAPDGLRKIAVRRSRLEGQNGGLWRWVVELETELMRGAPRSPAAPVLPPRTRAA